MPVTKDNKLLAEAYKRVNENTAPDDDVLAGMNEVERLYFNPIYYLSINIWNREDDNDYFVIEKRKIFDTTNAEQILADLYNVESGIKWRDGIMEKYQNLGTPPRNTVYYDGFCKSYDRMLQSFVSHVKDLYSPEKLAEYLDKIKREPFGDPVPVEDFRKEFLGEDNDEEFHEDSEEFADDDILAGMEKVDDMLTPVYECVSDYCRGYGGSDWAKISLFEAMEAYRNLTGEEGAGVEEYTNDMPKSPEEFAKRLLEGQLVSLYGEEVAYEFCVDKDSILNKLIEDTGLNPGDVESSQNASLQHGCDAADFQTSEDIEQFLGLDQPGYLN